MSCVVCGFGSTTYLSEFRLIMTSVVLFLLECSLKVTVVFP